MVSEGEPITVGEWMGTWVAAAVQQLIDLAAFRWCQLTTLRDAMGWRGRLLLRWRRARRTRRVTPVRGPYR